MEKIHLLNDSPPNSRPSPRSDQLPFLSRRHFSALPFMRRQRKIKTLSVFFAALCVIDLFGVFPIIALPQPLIRCGLYGFPLALFVITLQIYTAVILGKCWVIAEKLDPSIVKKNRYPYAAIAEMTYGRYVAYFVTILLDLTIFGGGIPNILVAAQNLQLLGHRISDGQFYFSFCYWLVIIGVFLCPIMWLGSPKNMKALASLSVFTVSGVALLTWYCIIVERNNATNTPFQGVPDFPKFLDLLTAYGIMTFQLDLHPMLLTIQVDMQNKSKIGKSVCYGVLATCIMSGISTILAAYKFGTTVPNNILQNLSRSWPLYCAILLVTLQLCLSSAVGSSALFQHIENFFGISRSFSAKRCLVRSILVGLEVLIGEFLPRFDVIMGLIGGSLTGPLIFILPPLLYTKMCKLEKIYDSEVNQRLEYEMIRSEEEFVEEGEPSVSVTQTYEAIDENDAIIIRNPAIPFIYKRVKNCCKLLYSDCVLSMAIITFGLIATIASTYFNIFKVSQLLHTWSPCLGNISYSFSDL